MSLGIVQSQQTDVSGSTQVNGITTQFPSKTTAGNAFAVFYSVSDYAGTHMDMSAKDTQLNSFTLQNQANTNPSGGAQSTAALTAYNIAGDPTTADTITTYLSTNGDVEDDQTALIIEVTGVALTGANSAQNATVSNALAQGTANLVSGTVNITSAMLPCIAIAIAFNTSATATPYAPTVSGGLTLLRNCWTFGTGYPLATVGYQIITTPGTYQAVFNQVSPAASDCNVNLVVLPGVSTPPTAAIAWING